MTYRCRSAARLPYLEQIESDHATIVIRPKARHPSARSSPSSLTEAVQIVAVYTPSVSQTASAVFVVRLDQDKGRFGNLRSACVVEKYYIADAVPYRGRPIEAAYMLARRQARRMSSLVSLKESGAHDPLSRVNPT